MTFSGEYAVLQGNPLFSPLNPAQLTPVHKKRQMA